MHPVHSLRIGAAALAIAGLAVTACSGSKTAADAGTSAGQTSGTSGGGASSGAAASSATGSSGSTGSPASSSGTTGSHGGTSAVTTGGSSSSSGGSSAGSSGGTGGGCVQLSGDCALENCCAGLTCNLSDSTCIPLVDAGPGCAGFAQACTPFSCCNGLGCAGTGPDAGTCVVAVSCGPNAPGGPCTTMANCEAPDVCVPSDGGGVCGPATLPSSVCLSNGQSCGSTEPCCGACDGGLCAAKIPCAFELGPCTTSGDCCSGLQCAGGACAPSCGGEAAVCNPANGDADCCEAEGFTCLATSQDGGVCGYVYQAAAFTPVSCGGPCSSDPCALGAFCQPPSGTVTTDPCHAAGFVCDTTYEICRDPAEGDSCNPGGPACQPIADSTATNLTCLPLPAEFGSAQVCLQPCNTLDPQNGTSDCVDPLMVCTSLGAGLGSACVYDIGNDACPTGALFQPCNSAGTGDGICVPDNFSGVTDGLCYQAATDGGEPGAACNEYANRQTGGLCNNQSYCIAGVCLPVCNAGTSGAPACAPAADGGVPIACLPLFDQAGNSDDFGACTPACDFTSATGGGCTTSPEGTPEKCLPQLYFGLPDSVTGLCVEAPAAGTAVAVGQPCTLPPLLADDCVDGALCLSSPLSSGGTCVQLCTQVGSAGQAPCGTGLVCDPLDEGTAVPIHTGYCGLSDGGI